MAEHNPTMHVTPAIRGFVNHIRQAGWLMEQHKPTRTLGIALCAEPLTIARAFVAVAEFDEFVRVIRIMDTPEEVAALAQAYLPTRVCQRWLTK